MKRNQHMGKGQLHKRLRRCMEWPEEEDWTVRRLVGTMKTADSILFYNNDPYFDQHLMCDENIDETTYQ